MFFFDEIGSEFWKADIKDNIQNVINGAIFTASGRSAQSLVIENLYPCRKSVLLPAYTCQHIVEPFAWRGWEVDFYDINSYLHIDKDCFVNKLSNHPSCILIQSYYGFNTALEIVPFLKKAQDEGCVIIEDITHSFLSDFRYMYQNADYYFCSLRKWSGLDDGGFCLSNCAKELKEPNVTMDNFFMDRRSARVIKMKYKESGEVRLKEEYLRLFANAETALDLDVGVYRMSSGGLKDFQRLDFDLIREKRRENFLYLLKNIHSSYVEPIFSILDDGVVPLMFPVFIPEKRQKLRKKLIENRIYCPVHWPQPTQLNIEAIENNSWIYNSIMSIPCDQRYTPSELNRLVKIINEFEG